MLENLNLEVVKEIVSCVLILMGVCFMFIATIGLLRFPDFYIRMSAITKGATLGVGLILLGLGIYFNQPDIMLKVLAIIIFTFITAPVAAHVIGRTAVRNHSPFWPKTNLQEFEEYMLKDHLEKMKNHDRYAEEHHEVPKPSDGGGT
ncbi:monovalent cation/H(+) antiporter subunit G [Pontibacter cellulosilyticus]|uniref:Monovalent cation/H(+) antiporter subunit G n=1 Tax=Pontibacter cellulosilyticus TaxID=1720253 RepID=A0A923N3G6_9BACT|nr:monovalent cation/H(+) antiporter subunit G [Pontibacter cellulosilyticus]MBC5991783.1 monovalent cation/H(+) antiporter subunit G [Pontibacter cellulosilyticus]